MKITTIGPKEKKPRFSSQNSRAMRPSSGARFRGPVSQVLQVDPLRDRPTGSVLRKEIRAGGVNRRII